MAGLALDLPRPSALPFAQVEEGFPLQAQRLRAPLLDLLGLFDPPQVGRVFAQGRREHAGTPLFYTPPKKVEEVEEVEEWVVKPLGLQQFSLLDLAPSPGLEVKEVEERRAAIAARRDRWLLGAILGA